MQYRSPRPLPINPPPSPPQQLLPLHNPLLKPNQKHRLPRPHLPLRPSPLIPHPMRTDPRPHPQPRTHPLHNARHERRAIQLAHLLRHADVLVHQRLVVRDHVLRGVRRARLDGVGGAREEMHPERAGDELQEGEDARGARLGGGGGGGGEGGGAVEEEREEALAEGEALDGESVVD